MLVLDDLDLNSVARIVNLLTPSGAADAATKAYVDAAASGAVNAKASVASMSTANVTLSGVQNLDGVTGADGQRVLLTGQTSGAQNGIWVQHTGAWTRATDFASGSAQAGAFVFVEGGTVNASSGWIITGAGTVTVDTTAHTWTQFSGAGEITAGTGLTKAGNTLSLTSPVTVATGGTGATSAANARANLGVPGKFAATIGDGAATAYTVNHNLASTDVIVQVWTTAAQPALVVVDIKVTDANNVQVTFASAPAANSYRVVCLG